MSNSCELVEIVVRFNRETARYLDSKKYYYGFVREEEDGAFIRMHFLISHLEMFGRWLLMFTNQATVESPAELVTTMQRLTCEISQLYK